MISSDLTLFEKIREQNNSNAIGKIRLLRSNLEYSNQKGKIKRSKMIK